MSVVVAAVSLTLIVLVLWDAFEAVLLPRRVTRPLRFSHFYYVHSWKPWAALSRRIRPGKRRNSFLSLFGPLSVLVLIGLWASGLITGFALLQWSLGTDLHGPDDRAGPGTYFYLSGTTFFTLGFGDVTPLDPPGRALSVIEAGLGFGFLAVVISYLPVLYQAFSGREVTISLLDARAGSPPSAAPTADPTRPGPQRRPRSGASWRSGSGGRPRCWRATSRSRCSAIIARSTTTSRGWRR